MTHDQATELVETFFAAFPRSKVTKATMDIYVASLVHLEAGPLSRTLTLLTQEEEWLPSLAKIHRKVRELGSQNAASNAFERHADPTCTVCKGSGWVDGKIVQNGPYFYERVAPCICRGGPGPAFGVVGRGSFPDDANEALCAFETALGAPVNDDVLSLIARDLRTGGAEKAVSRLRNALHFTHFKSPKDFLGSLFPGVK